MIRLINLFQNLNLGLRLNLITGLTLVLLLLIMGRVGQESYATLTKNVGQQRVREEMEVIRNHLTEAEQDALTGAKIVSASPGLVEAVAQHDLVKLRTSLLVGAAPFAFDEIDLADAQGHHLPTGVEQGQVDDPGEAELLSLGLLGVSTTALTNEAGSDPALRLSAVVPLKDRLGQMVGALLVSRTMNDDFLAWLNFSRSEVHLVLIANGQPMAQHLGDKHSPSHASNTPLSTVATTLLSNPALTQAQQGQTAIAENMATMDQDQYSLAYLPLTTNDETKGVMAILFEVGQLNDFQSQLTRTLSIISAILTLLAVGIMALFFRYSIARPLGQLSAVAERMSAGDLSARSNNQSKNEIGFLAASFNHMAAELQQTLTGLEQRVTERTRDLAEARDRALEASRLKTELLAKVSHELRTPLGAILGYSEMLKMGIYGSLSPRQQEVTQEVIDSTNYLTGMVNQLLEQAQLDAGKLKLNLTPFSLTDVLEGSLSKVTPLAHYKGLTLTHELATDMPDTLYGDPVRVQQILVNLLSNAIKFTPAGTVQVHLYRSDPEHWAIQVSDTGIGIPAEAHAHIFESFGQVDGSITREYAGTGLGLSIVKQLTTLMEGEVRLESKVGQGSIFTVLLPLESIQKNESASKIVLKQ